MLKKIAVIIITPTHTKKSFDLGLIIAKKFDSELSVIKCVYKMPPKFYFFETRSDKEYTKKQRDKIKKELIKWKEIANKRGMRIKTKFALTDSVANWVIEYIKENKIEMVIVDYPKLSLVEMNQYDDIVNMIHRKAHCHVLTTKDN